MEIDEYLFNACKLHFFPSIGVENSAVPLINSGKHIMRVRVNAINIRYVRLTNRNISIWKISIDQCRRVVSLKFFSSFDSNSIVTRTRYTIEHCSSDPGSFRTYSKSNRVNRLERGEKMRQRNRVKCNAIDQHR